jgi:hypothetical protein
LEKLFFQSPGPGGQAAALIIGTVIHHTQLVMYIALCSLHSTYEQFHGVMSRLLHVSSRHTNSVKTEDTKIMRETARMPGCASCEWKPYASFSQSLVRRLVA